MPRLLEFRHTYSYPDGHLQPGITIPLKLRVNERAVSLIAKIDTGADFCLFDHHLAERLGLAVESGRKRSFQTMAGRFEAYEHRIVIETFDIGIESYVYFAADPQSRRNLLGRTGWLEHFRLAVSHHECELFLSAYDS